MESRLLQLLLFTVFMVCSCQGAALIGRVPTQRWLIPKRTFTKLLMRTQTLTETAASSCYHTTSVLTPCPSRSAKDIDPTSTQLILQTAAIPQVEDNVQKMVELLSASSDVTWEVLGSNQDELRGPIEIEVHKNHRYEVSADGREGWGFFNLDTTVTRIVTVHQTKRIIDPNNVVTLYISGCGSIPLNVPMCEETILPSTSVHHPVTSSSHDLPTPSLDTVHEIVTEKQVIIEPNDRVDNVDETVTKLQDKVTEEPMTKLQEKVTDEPLTKLQEKVTEEPMTKLQEKVTEEPMTKLQEKVTEVPKTEEEQEITSENSTTEEYKPQEVETEITTMKATTKESEKISTETSKIDDVTEVFKIEEVVTEDTKIAEIVTDELKQNKLEVEELKVEEVATEKADVKTVVIVEIVTEEPKLADFVREKLEMEESVTDAKNVVTESKIEQVQTEKYKTVETATEKIEMEQPVTKIVNIAEEIKELTTEEVTERVIIENIVTEKTETNKEKSMDKIEMTTLEEIKDVVTEESLRFESVTSPTEVDITTQITIAPMESEINVPDESPEERAIKDTISAVKAVMKTSETPGEISESGINLNAESLNQIEGLQAVLTPDSKDE